MIDRDELVQLRVVEELSNAEIGARLGIKGSRVRAMLERHGITLSADAIERMKHRGTAKGRESSAAARRKPNAAQQAWNLSSRPAAAARAAAAAAVDRPKITGTDLAEMVARAIASGYPVTVLPTVYADGSVKMFCGKEVG